MTTAINVTLTTLHCLPIFRNIPDSQLELLIPLCRALEYNQDEVIISAGDESSDFYLILSGTTRVVLKREALNNKGREKEVVIAYLNSGDFFGELSMLDAGPRSANVIADSESCVVSISGHDFRKVIRHNADIAFFMLHNLSSRIRQSDEKIRSFALQDVSCRVLLELESLAKKEGSENIIEQRVSRQELARRVGASREMVGRAMRELEVSGHFSFNNGALQLNNKK